MNLGDKVIVFYNADYPWVGKIIGDNGDDYLVADTEEEGQNWFPHSDVLPYQEGLIRLEIYSDLLKREINVI